MVVTFGLKVYDDVNVSDVLEVLANISSKRDIDQESPTMRVLNEEANANMVSLCTIIK